MTRTMSGETSSGGSGTTVDIPVWIHGSEKLVTGLSKHTSCDDVIYSLLTSGGARHAEIETLNYVIYERWRKVDRPLPGKSKLAKVWKAWGPERGNVKFTVKHVEVPAVAALKAKRRQQNHSKRRHGEPHDFYDPEKVRAEKNRIQTIEDLVHLLGEQHRKLQEQSERMDLTDREVELFETDVHLSRMRERGQNYVQDSYLLSQSDDSSGLEDSHLQSSDVDSYIEICENVLRLEREIALQKGEMERLSSGIEESSSTEDSGVSASRHSSATYRERATLKERIRATESESERNNTELSLICSQLTDREVSLRQKQQLADQLAAELAELENEVIDQVLSGEKSDRLSPVPYDEQSRTSREYRTRVQSRDPPAPIKSSEAMVSRDDSLPAYRYCLQTRKVTQVPIKSDNTVLTATNLSHAYSCGDLTLLTDTRNGGLATKYHDSDSNSDTGLSSLHSDEIQVVLETLV